MKLEQDNYYSQQSNTDYWSYSQYKQFKQCEHMAMGTLNGEYSQPLTIALLIGSYVDAYFEGTLDSFIKKHPELFTRKSELRAAFKHANTMIKTAEKDTLFMKFMSGEKQKIFTGHLFGVQWKIKIDSYIRNKCIADLKTVSDIHYIPTYRYDLQGALYQKIVEINTGKRLPFYIAAIEKKKIPALYIYQMTDDILDTALEEIERNIKHFDSVKKREIMPTCCGKCDFCRLTKPVVIKNYKELLEGNDNGWYN